MSEVIELPNYVHFESGARLTLRRGSIVLRSRYTGKRQTLVLPYALWVFEGKLVPVEGTDAADWRGFLVDLDGQANTFRLPVPGTVGPSSGYSGPEATVDGAGQSGRTINLTGITPNAVYLRRGDYITINDELKVVQANVSANALGKATVDFKPRLRKSPPNGSVTKTRNPTVLVSAQDDDVASWELNRPVRHHIALSAIEAIED
jgi:hypothetical protein